MMINDYNIYSVFRDIPARNMFDPYSAFNNHDRGYVQRSPATGLSESDLGRRARSREFIIPIQVEGREPPLGPAPVQHIDLTRSGTSDENINNSGLHNRSRNRRRYHVNTLQNGGGKFNQSGMSTFPLSGGAQCSVDSGAASRENVPTTSSRSTSSHMSEDNKDIIDLCMYEDMYDSDVCISESYEDNTLKASRSKSSLSSKSESSVVKVNSQTKQNGHNDDVASKVITPTPSYPVYRYLKSQLVRDGRLIDYIRGDGNCFFRALSKEIYGSEEFHEDVRQAVVDLIEKYSKEFEQFLDSGMVISDHIKDMRKASTWASSAEIYAAATLVQRDIYVLSPDHTGDTYHWMLFKPRFMYTRDTSYHPCFITLCHTHGNHYDRITPIQGKCNCDYEPPVLSGVQAYVDLTK